MLLFFLRLLASLAPHLQGGPCLTYVPHGMVFLFQQPNTYHESDILIFCNFHHRPEPIPVFAEMGSVNPVVVLPEALQQHFDAVVSGAFVAITEASTKAIIQRVLVVTAGLAGSLTLGAGTIG